jgi:signal transduction histidine kinase
MTAGASARDRQMAFDMIAEIERGVAPPQASGRLGAGALAHDLNNLLNVILAANEAIVRDLPEGSEGRELAALSQTAAEKGAALVGRLLDVAATGPAVAVDAARALADAARIARPLAPAVTVEAAPAAPGCRCLADPLELERGLLNLCANAAHATPAGGRIVLSAEAVVLDGARAAALGLAAGAYVRLSVRDDGAGMPPEVLARATEPYFTTRRGRGGTGLGLAAVRDFARVARGALALASEVGRGTTASLYLPQA